MSHPLKKKVFRKFSDNSGRRYYRINRQHSSQTQGNTNGEYETLQVKGIKVMREKE